MTVVRIDHKTPMRAVVYGPRGRYELTVMDLADLCRQAIEKGLVVIR